MSEKTDSQRLEDPALVPFCRHEILIRREFETVVDELVRVGERLKNLAVAEVVQEKLLVEGEQAAEVRRLSAAQATRPTAYFEAW